MSDIDWRAGELPGAPRWVSLCCGLAATETRAMTGRFPPVARTGGKRAVADHVLEILGSWPRSLAMVDSDPAIVKYWDLAFSGQMGEVAEVIRAAPLDGEDLWRAWSAEPVPEDEVERVARWIVIQAGHYAGIPVGVRGNSWARVTTEKGTKLAGFKYGLEHPQSDVSPSVRFLVNSLTFLHHANPNGEISPLDLRSERPEVRPGDLLTIDPPYRGTTGCGSGLSRGRVVEIALEAHSAGARVAVHEAEPIITGGPWRHVELERRHGTGQRTWSKQTREILTLNFSPKGQRGLFG